VSEFDSRLAALDPVAGQAYEHSNLEDLIARVTATPRAPKRRVWRNVELKVAATLIAGSIAAAGAVAIFQSAPGLAVLALKSSAANHNFASANLPASSAVQFYERLDFTAGPGITSTPTTPSYKLSFPANPASESTRVAAVFGVAGTPVNTSGDWTVTGASGAALDYQTAGVPQWYYSSSTPAVAPATESASATGPVPSPAIVAADATRYLSLLGYGYGVGSPKFSSSTSSTTAANGTTQVTQSTEDVTYQVVVGGVATDQTVTFSVDSHNVVVYASGPAFSVGAVVNYPLQSPVEGAAALNATQASLFAAGNAKASSAVGSSTTTTLAPPPVVDVTLNSDSVALATYQLTDGTFWFLPVSTYIGMIASTTGPTSGTWSELAIEPTYVQVGARAPGAITSGGLSN